MANVEWRFHKDNEFFTNFKTKRFKDTAFLEWLRGLKCFACRTGGGFHGDWAMGNYDRVTASHIFRGFGGMKNHDWAAVPMCGECHWTYEFHRDKYIESFGKEPTAEDADKLYKKFLQESGKKDLRTPEQMKPI